MECGPVGSSMKFFLLTFIFLTIVSCGKRGQLYFEDKKLKLINNLVTYESVKKNILDTQCIGCHKGFSEEKNLFKFINEDAPEESRLFLSVKTGSMPKGKPPLNSEDLEMIRLYVNQVEVIRDVSFAELNEKIIAPKCVGCHKKMTTEEALSRWINPESLMDSKLLKSTANGSMPKNAPPLTKKELNMIRGFLKTKKL